MSLLTGDITMHRFYLALGNHGLYAFTILGTLALATLPYLASTLQPPHLWLISLAALSIGLLAGATAVQMVFKKVELIDFHIIFILGLLGSCIPGSLAFLGLIPPGTEHALNLSVTQTLMPFLAWLMVHFGIQAVMILLKRQLYLPQKVRA
ncbi:MAG: hypothetical protein EON60_08840 [Alphaproteobacteria bacterium]|nr:MAG: hypothetical protein EON60_08840 [Alphaproteobacteria bacterium]